jgi:hypothetical protein
LQQRLVKTGGRLIKHARYNWLLLAESDLTTRLFGNILQKDRGTAVAGGIRRAQIAVATLWRRETCLRNRVKK